jgi:hypothetical protein
LLRWDAKGAEVVDFAAGTPLEDACLAAPFGHVFQFALSGTRLSAWADLDALNTYGVHTADSKVLGGGDATAGRRGGGQFRRNGSSWNSREYPCNSREPFSISCEHHPQRTSIASTATMIDCINRKHYQL